MVTCRHVLKCVPKPDTAPGATYPTMALQVDSTVLNLSYFVAQGIKLSVQAVESEFMSPEVDIALACIDGSHWYLLSTGKNKVAIDLDSWLEPNWDDVKHCLAVGYPNEGKETISDDGESMVATPILNVVAELSSTVNGDTTGFTMYDKLSSSLHPSFGGMSGGAVYAIEGSVPRKVQDEELFPVGIIFEGHSGKKQETDRNNEKAVGSILTEQGILIRAVMLTPDTFDDWLKKSGI